jgi:hypothetical protein
MAAIKPADAGAPEARAIPMDKGRAMRAIEKPAEKSHLIWEVLIISFGQCRSHAYEIYSEKMNDLIILK